MGGGAAVLVKISFVRTAGLLFRIRVAIHNAGDVVSGVNICLVSRQYNTKAWRSISSAKCSLFAPLLFWPCASICLVRTI